jgi:hypothetical protein
LLSRRLKPSFTRSMMASSHSLEVWLSDFFASRQAAA